MTIDEHWLHYNTPEIASAISEEYPACGRITDLTLKLLIFHQGRLLVLRPPESSPLEWTVPSEARTVEVIPEDEEDCGQQLQLWTMLGILDEPRVLDKISGVQFVEFSMPQPIVRADPEITGRAAVCVLLSIAEWNFDFRFSGVFGVGMGYRGFQWVPRDQVQNLGNFGALPMDLLQQGVERYMDTTRNRLEMDFGMSVVKTVMLWQLGMCAMDCMVRQECRTPEVLMVCRAEGYWEKGLQIFALDDDQEETVKTAEPGSWMFETGRDEHYEIVLVARRNWNSDVFEEVGKVRAYLDLLPAFDERPGGRLKLGRVDLVPQRSMNFYSNTIVKVE